MFGLPIQFWSSEVYEIGSALLDIAARMWWVWAFILLAWFLRWYGMARDAGVESPGIRGLTLWFSDLFRTGRTAIVIGAGLVAVVLGFFGFAFDILPAALGGIAGGDPLTIAIVATMMTVISTPFDENIVGEHIVTPEFAALVFIGALAIALAVETASEYYEEVDD